MDQKPLRIDPALLTLAASIQLVVFDVDGVLTDGRLYFGDNGSEFKAFHVRDGHGFKLLQEAGVKVAALSGRRSAAVTRRMDELRVDMYRQGCQDKDRDLIDLLRHFGIAAAAERSQEDQAHRTNGRILLNPAGQLQPAHHRHVQIENRQIEGRAASGSRSKPIERANPVVHAFVQDSPSAELMRKNFSAFSSTIKHRRPWSAASTVG